MQPTSAQERASSDDPIGRRVLRRHTCSGLLDYCRAASFSCVSWTSFVEDRKGSRWPTEIYLSTSAIGRHSWPMSAEICETKGSRDRRTGVIDPKAEIAHIGKTHASLIVLCLGLLVITVLGRSSPHETALLQLAELERVAETWDPGWVIASLETSLGSALSDLVFVNPLPVECDPCTREPPKVSSDGRKRSRMGRLEPGRTSQGLLLRFDRLWSPLPLPRSLLELTGDGGVDPSDQRGPLWARRRSPPRKDLQFLQPNPSVFSIEAAALGMPAPSSLARFEQYWESLASMELEVCYPDNMPPFWIGLYTNTSSLDRLDPTDEAGDAWPELQMYLQSLTPDEQALWRDRTEHQLQPTHHFVGFTRWGRVSAPIECAEVRVDMLRAFQKFYGVNWPPDSLARVFPELTSVAIHESDLSLDKLRAVLDFRREAAQKEIEFLGIKIRESGLTRLAIPLLLALQGYLLLHLRALRGLFVAQQGVSVAPWIGIMRDPLSRVTTCATSFLAPPLVVGLLASRQGSAAPWWLLGVIASATLGLLSFYSLRSFWRLADATDESSNG